MVPIVIGAATIALSINAIILQRIWASIKTNDDELHTLSKRINRLEVDIATTYVPKIDLQIRHEEVLKRIDKLDSRFSEYLAWQRRTSER